MSAPLTPAVIEACRRACTCDDDPAAHAERDASEAPPRRLTFGKPESLVCKDPGVTAETWTVQQWTTPELNAAAKRLAEHQVTERVQEGRP